MFATNFGEKCTINLKSYLNNVEATEAVMRSYSIKEVFLKILKKSQENVCTGVSFLIKVAGWK